MVQKLWKVGIIGIEAICDFYHFPYAKIITYFQNCWNYSNIDLSARSFKYTNVLNII